MKEESEFIRRKEDLVTLRSSRESANFDAFVERCLNAVDDFFYEWINRRIVLVSRAIKRYRVWMELADIVLAPSETVPDRRTS